MVKVIVDADDFGMSEAINHGIIKSYVDGLTTSTLLMPNFYPAKIFLGDTGALFLGFMIAVMSLQGLKNATFITVITPMVILGVPINF